MAEKGLWFDDDLEHSAQEWADFFGGAFSTGVNVYGNPKALQVEAKTGMTVKVNSGKAYINGRYYDSGGDLEFALTPYSGSTKLVRIVIRVDMAEKYIRAFVKEGAAATGLTRNNSVYEISLASISIPALASSITSEMITDERSNLNLCGFLRFLGHEAERVPAGAVEFYAGQNAPVGWLECNGSIVSRSVYPDLFGAIGTRYGAGDGSTTFNLPDLRGEFIRGWDNGKGIDPGRELGSNQEGTSLKHIDDSSSKSVTLLQNGESPINEVSKGNPSGSGYTTTGIRYTFRPRNVALMPIIKI